RGLALLAADASHPRHAAWAELGPGAGSLLLALFGKRSLAEALTAGPDRRDRALVTLFEDAYGRYRARLGAAMVAPGEVERRALRALDVPQARARLAARFPVVLVDEFQDVNPVQGAFFERLETAGVQVEVVGDPKQSIYGFRNADVRVFRRALSAAEASGEVQPPLTDTRRHARHVAGFLNRLTDGLAANALGFVPAEAPAVAAAGSQAGVAGAVELHWVVGEARIAELRRGEAAVLAGALAEHHALGVAFDDMAVLARSYSGLGTAEAALRAAGIPCVMLQGRGYYERSEIRDLVHALRVGVRPEGVSLAACLRGPLGGLGLAEIDAVLAAERPLAELEARHPEVAERLAALQRIARLPPLEALKRLVRDPLVAGKRYVEFLDDRQRQNVDALLFDVAARAPRDLQVLIERLELLSRQAEAGDVPQSGDGVRLLTVHRAKGLEFALAAVFDAGRMPFQRAEPLYLDAADGRPHVAGSEGYERARRQALAREEQESYRLLYVAASRARDVLLVTGSVKAGQPQGWAAALARLGLGPRDSGPGAAGDVAASEAGGAAGARGSGGPDEGGGFPDAGETPAAGDTLAAGEPAQAGIRLVTHPLQAVPVPAGARPEAAATGLVAAPWLERRFRAHRYPPVFSPSRLKAGTSPEPRAPSDPGDWDDLPGRATAVGTLVHYAIGQDWPPGERATRVNLAAQEVMFPFAAEEREDVLDEVIELLGRYTALLGGALPALSARERDLAELPVAVPHGGTVWQGVIDRLYRAGGSWVVEDYKTDQRARSQPYAFQLALYAHAVERALGERPAARLVFLRPGEVVELGAADLDEAFAAAMEGRAA
ncbi:MAG: UvrD-helicase domain-containing protein, partial [Deinococcales bacterium]